MLEGNPSPLSIASKVLGASTLASIRRHPYHLVAWNIADRWAFNQPERLKALEAEGEIMVLIRLLEQQEVEHDVLLASQSEQLDGLSPTEVLLQHGIELGL